MPPVPLVAHSVRPETQIIHRNMLNAVLIVDEPALGEFSAVATHRWGEVSMDLGLGTSRPPKVHVGLDPSKRFLFMAPTTNEDPLGLEVKYSRGRTFINLSKAFVPLNRYVEAGRREYYHIGITPDKVRFDDGFESASLYVYLTPFKTEPRRSMSEETKAKLRATRLKKKQASQGGPETATTGQ